MSRFKSLSPYVALAAIGISFSILMVLTSGPARVYCAKPFAQRDHHVVMFSTGWCPYCRQARVLFEENDIKYCEYDVESSEENNHIMSDLGGVGVPLFMVGDKVLHGFDEYELKRELYSQNYM